MCTRSFVPVKARCLAYEGSLPLFAKEDEQKLMLQGVLQLFFFKTYKDVFTNEYGGKLKLRVDGTYLSHDVVALIAAHHVDINGLVVGAAIIQKSFGVFAMDAGAEPVKGNGVFHVGSSAEWSFVGREHLYRHESSLGESKIVQKTKSAEKSP
jgi:hypothetical protein